MQIKMSSESSLNAIAEKSHFRAPTNYFNRCFARISINDNRQQWKTKLQKIQQQQRWQRLQSSSFIKYAKNECDETKQNAERKISPKIFCFFQITVCIMRDSIDRPETHLSWWLIGVLFLLWLCTWLAVSFFSAFSSLRCLFWILRFVCKRYDTLVFFLCEHKTATN